MGRYGEVAGVEVKFVGLLAHAAAAVIGEERARDGSVELSYDEARDVALEMRRELLDGWAHQASDYNVNDEPLCNLQDIMHFAGDVRRFELLCIWVIHTRVEDKLCFG